MRAVISFHAIDDGPGPLSFPASAFSKLLAAFRASDLPVMDLGTLLSPHTARGVALTFDDGMACVAETALPILRDQGVPAHLFLTTGAVGKDNRWPGQPEIEAYSQMLDWDQVEQLHAGGVMIEGHTANHPDLRTLDGDDIAAELARADDAIESRLGRRPRYFAYPYGFHDRRVRAAVSPFYDGCVTTELRRLGTNVAMDAIPRLDSHYLRSPLLMRHLSGPAAGGYLTLRHIIRRLQNKT